MGCSLEGKSVKRLQGIQRLLIGGSFGHVVSNSRRSERIVRDRADQTPQSGRRNLRLQHPARFRQHFACLPYRTGFFTFENCDGELQS